MAKTSEEQVQEVRERKAEYEKIRSELIRIVNDPKAKYTDKVGAINAIYRLDVEGIPMPKGW